MYIRVDRDGYFGKFLEHCLAAYERRTDVMEASSDVAIQRKIDAMVADMKASTDQLGQAVENDTKGK